MSLDYRKIADRFFSLFVGKKQREIIEALFPDASFSSKQAQISNWKNYRENVSWDALIRALELHPNQSWDWLLTGRDVVREPSNARPREPINFVIEVESFPVVGRAAADETQGAHAGFFPPDADRQWDSITIPRSASLVEILGDSMSPVLLDGQFAFIGQEFLYGQKPQNYSIVIVDVQVGEQEQAGSDARWEGVYCKRVVDLDSVWAFLSINHTGTPFTIAKQNCRLWPVIGVWFAGHGIPPMED